MPTKMPKSVSATGEGQDPNRFYCPFPKCNRSFAELWRLKVHYRAEPDVRGSGKERGHGCELQSCPKCGKELKAGKHHVGCFSGRAASRQAMKKQRSASLPDSTTGSASLSPPETKPTKPEALQSAFAPDYASDPRLALGASMRSGPIHREHSSLPQLCGRKRPFLPSDEHADAPRAAATRAQSMVGPEAWAHHPGQGSLSHGDSLAAGRIQGLHALRALSLPQELPSTSGLPYDMASAHYAAHDYTQMAKRRALEAGRPCMTMPELASLFADSQAIPIPQLLPPPHHANGAGYPQGQGPHLQGHVAHSNGEESERTGLFPWQTNELPQAEAQALAAARRLALRRDLLAGAAVQGAPLEPLGSPADLSALPLPLPASLTDYGHDPFQPTPVSFNEQPALSEHRPAVSRIDFRAIFAQTVEGSPASPLPPSAPGPMLPSAPGPLGEALGSPPLARERPQSAIHPIGLRQQIAASLNYDPLLEPLSPVATPRPSYAQLDTVFQQVGHHYAQVQPFESAATPRKMFDPPRSIYKLTATASGVPTGLQPAAFRDLDDGFASAQPQAPGLAQGHNYEDIAMAAQVKAQFCGKLSDYSDAPRNWSIDSEHTSLMRLH